MGNLTTQNCNKKQDHHAKGHGILFFEYFDEVFVLRQRYRYFIYADYSVSE